MLAVSRLSNRPDSAQKSIEVQPPQRAHVNAINDIGK